MKRVQTHREGVFGEGATECSGKEAVFLAATSGYLDETPEKGAKKREVLERRKRKRAFSGQHGRGGLDRDGLATTKRSRC